jgi:hypothetical protein
MVRAFLERRWIVLTLLFFDIASEAMSKNNESLTNCSRTLIVLTGPPMSMILMKPGWLKLTIYTVMADPRILSSTWLSHSRLLVPCLVQTALQLPRQIHSPRPHWHFCLY